MIKCSSLRALQAISMLTDRLPAGNWMSEKRRTVELKQQKTFKLLTRKEHVSLNRAYFDFWVIELLRINVRSLFHTHIALLSFNVFLAHGILFANSLWVHSVDYHIIWIVIVKTKKIIIATRTFHTQSHLNLSTSSNLGILL